MLHAACYLSGFVCLRCLLACTVPQLELSEIEAALLEKGFVKEVSAKGILQV